MNTNQKLVFKSFIIVLVFVFGAAFGRNIQNSDIQENFSHEQVTLEELDAITNYDTNMVSMSMVRANQMNRDTTTIWDSVNDTIIVNMTLTEFGDVGISHNTTLKLTKNGVVYEPVNFIKFVETGYICRKRGIND